MRTAVLALFMAFFSCSPKLVHTYPIPPEVVKKPLDQKPSSEVLFLEVAVTMGLILYFVTGRTPLDRY